MPDGALSTEVEADKATISPLRNFGLNLAMFPSEFLHPLQAGVIAEIRAWEQRVISMISEQKVNNK